MLFLYSVYHTLEFLIQLANNIIHNMVDRNVKVALSLFLKDSQLMVNGVRCKLPAVINISNS